jgi:hypothetical protein
MDKLKSNYKKIEQIEMDIFDEYGKFVHKNFFVEIVKADKVITAENDEDKSLQLFLIANTIRSGLMN